MLPTAAIITSNIFTDFRYFFVLKLVPFFENAPAPKEMTRKNIKTNIRITDKISIFPSIYLTLYLIFLKILMTFCHRFLYDISSI